MLCNSKILQSCRYHVLPLHEGLTKQQIMFSSSRITNQYWHNLLVVLTAELLLDPRLACEEA